MWTVRKSGDMSEIEEGIKHCGTREWKRKTLQCESLCFLSVSYKTMGRGKDKQAIEEQVSRGIIAISHRNIK